MAKCAPVPVAHCRRISSGTPDHCSTPSLVPSVFPLEKQNEAGTLPPLHSCAPTLITSYFCFFNFLQLPQMIMKSRVLATFWRLSSGPLRTSIRILGTTTGGVFEPMPREELVTKCKSRLRDRQFLPGSSGGGFPEFLAEPRDSFPLAVRVNNRNQSSLAELTEKCMDYVKEHISRNPAILFRGLPAETANDFSIIAKATREKSLIYEGGTAPRSQVDKIAGTYTASDEANCFTVELHNEMAYNDVFPSKVSSNTLVY